MWNSIDSNLSNIGLYLDLPFLLQIHTLTQCGFYHEPKIDRVKLEDGKTEWLINIKIALNTAEGIPQSFPMFCPGPIGAFCPVLQSPDESICCNKVFIVWVVSVTTRSTTKIEGKETGSKGQKF